MGEIIRGTTPTIMFKFSVIDPADITTAYMTMMQCGNLIAEHDLSDAVIGQDTLSWKLTQPETLSIRSDLGVMIQLRWKLQDGTAGASKEAIISGLRILKDGVI